MNQDELSKRIDEANNLMISDEVEENVGFNKKMPTDLYQDQEKALRNLDTLRSHGAHPRAKLDLSILHNSKLLNYYNKAKDDSDYYEHIGNKTYSKLVKENYMQNYYLPMVDSLVQLNGQRALLANGDVLKSLDGLTLLDGNSGNGYTETIIKSLYQEEIKPERSDSKVKDSVETIKILCENEQIQNAVNTAKVIKKHIDSGENLASPEDYALIQKVALFNNSI